MSSDCSSPAHRAEPGVEGAQPLGRGTGSGGGGENPASAEPRRRRRNDRGASILEFAGFLPILLLVGTAGIQLGLIGYGINQAGTAARAAARAESLEAGAGAVAGQAAVSGWLHPEVGTEQGAETTTATVDVTVPAVIPLFGDFPIERSVTMPTDDGAN